MKGTVAFDSKWMRFIKPARPSNNNLEFQLFSMLYCDYASRILRNCERNEYILLGIHYDTYTCHTQAITRVRCV